MKYVHTNIIAKDWKKLSDFYIKVFNAHPVPPERNLRGEWLEKCTGVKDASLKGVHLLLPGFDKDGPTLEIFQYVNNEDKLNPVANREGYGHIAFSVDDVDAMLNKMISFGGTTLGEVIRKEFGKGTLICVYAKDPEGNIIELQNFEPKNI